MSGAELLYRVKQQLVLLLLRAQFTLGIGLRKKGRHHSTLAFCVGTARQLPPIEFDIDRINRDKDKLLSGSIEIHGHVWEWQNNHDIWHVDPETKKIWPKYFFGRIDYRTGNPYGDVRELWELSRLQHLVGVAIVGNIGDGADQIRCTEIVRNQFESWMACNPPLAGPHYISSMECALRLIAVCHIFDLLRNHITDDHQLWGRLVDLVYSHARLIELRTSLHSSAGNHTIAESAGLIYAGVIFSEIPGSSRWLGTGKKLLEAEAERQILPDGGGIEQATWYQLFNIHILWLVTRLLRHFHIRVPLALDTATNRGTAFLAALDSDGESLEQIGDSDSGYALSEYLSIPVHRPSPIECPMTTFTDSGYTVATIGHLDRSRFIFDHGPLGMPPNYGHGHADALALLLTRKSRRIFIETGTYTYGGDPKWREYFRSTRAHNTVTVDDLDQATQEDTFQWSEPYRADLLRSEVEPGHSGRLLATHDGYRSIGVKHLRAVAWERDRWLLIFDYLVGTGSHTLDLHWHLSPEIQCKGEEVVDLRSGDDLITMQCIGGDLSIQRGNTSPILGWHSPKYGVLEPTSTIRIHHDGRLPHVFRTSVSFSGNTIDARTGRMLHEWIQGQLN